jgi:hypothetical protein
MISQSTATSEFSLLLSTQLNIDAETCPSCGQQIPIDKIEEVRGKITLREHEQIVAVTARLEQKYEAERARAREQIEAVRKTAEENEARLRLQMEQLLQEKVDALESAKAQAKNREAQIRSEATEAAQVQLEEKMALNEGKMASANAKVLELEGKLATIVEQHTKTTTEQLSAQREVLEKAKEGALNAERAKAFEENQKLSNKVNELSRALEKKTSEELGEGAEIDLYEALKKEFPNDRITRIAKGTPGADVKHIVMCHGQECGTIIYDSKNHSAFRTEHVTKLKTDQLAAKAEHAILSTHKFPQGTRQLHIQDGVLLANPARVVSLATLLRQHIIQVHTLRLSRIERQQKTVVLYDFITSDRCTQLLGRVEERCEELLNQQAKEVKWHEKHWKQEGEMLRAIQKAKGDLESEISAIIGAEVDI